MKSSKQKTLWASLLCCISMVISGHALAGLSDTFSNFYKGYGGAANITKGGVYQDQGYYSMGGITARTPTGSLSPISLSAPGFRMGCNGIDAHFGALSHITGPQLKAFLNQILQSGMNYAFMIGLDAVCPMCKKTMDQLNKIAQEINSLNIGSCEATAAAFGAILPASETTQKYLCPALGHGSGKFGSYAQARQKCATDNGEIMAHAKQDKRTSNILNSFLLDGNLAWMVLHDKSDEFSIEGMDEDTFKELAMSLSGSIIHAYSSDEHNDIMPLPSLANGQLWETMLRGGTTKIYNCGTDKTADGCLAPTLKEITIEPEDSFSGMINKHLTSIKSKVVADEGTFTKAEINIINQSKRIPLKSIINHQVQRHPEAMEVITLDQCADIVAIDILDDYLNDTLRMVEMASSQKQLSKEEREPFIQGIERARKSMTRKARASKEDDRLIQDINMKIRILERSNEQSTIGEFLAATTYNKGIGVF